MSIDLTKAMRGEFACYVREIGDTVERRVGGDMTTDPQHNVITDIGWRDGYINPASVRYARDFHYYCWVGTGTVEHTVASVGLTTRLPYYSARRNSIGSGEVTIGGIRYFKVRNEYLLDSPAIRGVPISEIAVGYDTQNMCAGQLIKDEFGAPTTVTLKATEEMIVRYDIYFRLYDDVYEEIGTGVMMYNGVECPFKVLVNRSNKNITSESSYIYGYVSSPAMYVNKSYNNNVPRSEITLVKTEYSGKISWNMKGSVGRGGVNLSIKQIDYVGTQVKNYMGDVRIEFDTAVAKNYADSIVVNFNYEVKWRD